MLYDMKADAFRMMNRLEQKDRSREVARRRLVSEAHAGHQERHTYPIPGLADWVRKLVKRDARITPEPAS
jgi:hypothetical protein